jgi:hypothetical protein
LLIVLLSTAGTRVQAERVDFERDIRPILNNHCAGCHGGVKKNGGFSVISHSRITGETDSGEPAVVPGDAAGSELIRRVTAADPAERMPPEDHDGLSQREIELLEMWIDDGAAWPAHWSYAALPALPEDSLFEGQHPVDWYVGQQLQAKGIQPSPPAELPTLLRRLALDLNGLLPAAADVEEFAGLGEADRSQRVLEYADRLLASPHFGERWGRHWLDEARYADSEGYEKDSVKPDAYQYRDWVINAINEDMSFDQFTRRQLAGDLLPDRTAQDLIATKFHLQTQFNLEGGVDSEEDRTKRVIDRVSTLGAVWMGASIGCCQCHDHPYDAFRQTDFYHLYAFFNNMDFTADFLVSTPKDADKLREERRDKWQKLSDLLKKQLTDTNYNDDCQRELTRLRTFDNSKQFTRHMTERTSDRRQTYVFTRGDFRRPNVDGGTIDPGIPSPLGALQARGQTPDRLDLANWLVSEDNPTTARVTVNKIWMHLFGAPLAAQPQEFGSRGAPPSHPELLDYLARWFVDEARWSRKRLIRFIVSSQTYQQSAATRPELVSIDPNNRLLARQNRFRVEAEIVRDIALQTAGLLNDKVGGPSVFPPLPAIIAQQTYAGSFRFKASTGADRYRRGMSTFFRRTAIDPNLRTFDCPDSSLTKAQRDRSNNPLQALATLHNEVFHEAAQAFARRLLQMKDADETAEGRMTQAFVIAVGRHPTEAEVGTLTGLLRKSRQHYKQHPDQAQKLIGSYTVDGQSAAEMASWVATCRVILNLDEFLTRS